MNSPLKLNSLTRIARLRIVLFLNSAYLVAASFTVLVTGSLALFSEAGHVLVDVGGIALALYAIQLRPKISNTAKDIRILQDGNTRIARE